MASSIEWTNKTWNPTTGCTKISKECDFCYAETETYRKSFNLNLPKYKQGFDVVVEHAYTLNEPLKWKKPCTVFVNSMSDLFHKDISLDFIKQVFKVMNDTPQHTYQVLTKRGDILEKHSEHLNWTNNIWMGVSVGNQIATRRIKSLVKCGAKHKFLSIEPFIEEITEIDLKGIDWVIVGGESGRNEVRPMNKEWVLKIKEKCSEQDVAFFFKQWGKKRNNPNPNDPTINKLHRYHSKGGSELDGKVYWSNPTIEDDSMPTLDLFGDEYLIMDELDDLVTIWELKSHLPLANNELFENLKEDISINGLNDPILYITTPSGQKLVVEGHTRMMVLKELKRENVLSKELKETFASIDEIKLWMVKHQLGRRNLTIGERVKLAFISKPTIEHLAKENLSKGGKAFSKKEDKTTDSEEIEKVDTYTELAKIANVGRTTVIRYSKILANATESVIDSVNKGKVSIGSAHARLKNGNEVPNVEPKKSESLPTENIMVLKTIDEGEQKISNGEIDVIMIFDKTDKLDILKKNSKVKIGVYYLTK
jgi:protein gp37